LVRGLLRLALEDSVTAVRETAVSAVGVFYSQILSLSWF
jgi:hypothetical protein